MEPDQLVDLGQWLIVFSGIAAPPVISLVKNIGRTWSKRTKQALALLFAVAAALGAYAQEYDLGAVNLGDLEGFWAPFLAAVFMATITQYASYKLIWSSAAGRPLGLIEQPLASLGQPKNPGE